MSNKKDITLAELATEMREGFSRVNQGLETLNAKIDSVEENSQEFRKEAKGWFSDLEKGLFTEEEKEQIMAAGNR